MKNLEKYVKEIAHDILCASSESGSDVEQKMPQDIINGFYNFDTSYDSDELKKVVEWLMSEEKEQ